MPAWWGKKSTKVKDPQVGSVNSPSSSINYKSELIKKIAGREKPINGNYDEVSVTVLSRGSPKKSVDFGLRRGARVEGSSGFSGFDSPSSSDIVYPLPKPANDNQINGGIFGLGSGSVSVSSVSSCGSCDDHPHHDLGQLYPSRGQCDAKSSPLPNPGPASRGNTTASSPLHPRLSTLSLDSSSGRLDDWRSECHLLPRPPGPGSPTSPPSLPTPPRTPVLTESPTNSLSRWKKGRLLGRGTFGHVYVGFNSDNGQMCAIKEVRVVSDDQSSNECLQQLNQEITLLSQLSHPNIVQYYGSELSEESLGVYLEYVSGGSIHKLLQEYGPFREPVIQNYTRQILYGLAYLHGRSTVHRDIKGANILVDPNGDVKLADFGMAKHITTAASVLSFKGSPYWMAPEVVMNTNGYNLAVDVWSLGCTILEMATSKPPWHQFSGVQAIFKIGNSKDMPDIPDHLSSELKGFVRLCLQREPTRRPSASQLLDHSFVRDQTTSTANVNITRQAFPQTFSGSRTPTALEMRGIRNNNNGGGGSFEGEVSTKPNFNGSRGLISPSGENVRTITSLPVSPSSSPLRRRSEPVSCLVSPQHRSFPGQNGFTTNDHSIFMMRPNPNVTRTVLDPWLDAPQSRAQIPNRFPRTRPIV